MTTSVDAPAVLDTNVPVYALDAAAPQHEPAKAVCDAAAHTPERGPALGPRLRTVPADAASRAPGPSRPSPATPGGDSQRRSAPMAPSGGKPRGASQPCEGEDSNLHRSYPASTSTAALDGARTSSRTATSPTAAPSIPLDFPTLDERAIEIIDARERREVIDGAWAREFVRAVIAESDLGPLALDVLRAIDGDHPTAGGSVLALARAVRWSEG